MLTLKECRKLVDPKNEKFNDKELELMLGFLSDLMTIIVNDLKLKEHEKESCTNEPRIK
jgi:hypothetical protein